MKVIAKTTLVDTEGAHAPGSEVDIAEAEAMSLIERGLCVLAPTSDLASADEQQSLALDKDPPRQSGKKNR